MAKAFNDGASAAAAAELLTGHRVPGDVATRSRWRYLLDPHRTNSLSDRWVTQSVETTASNIHMEAEAELASIALEDSRPMWDELIAAEPQPFVRIVTVNATLGLADDARRRENGGEARELAERALAIAEEFDYRFGILRAGIILGYLDLISASYRDAQEQFDAAESMAHSIGEPLYEANAWLGHAQAHLVQGRVKPARAYAEKALRRFNRLGSTIGIGNATTLLTAIGESTPRGDGEPENVSTDVVGQVEALIADADRAVAEGRPQSAADSYTHAKGMAAERYPRGEAHAWMGLANLLLSVEANVYARAAFDEARQVYASISDSTGVAYSNVALSKTASLMGDRVASFEHDEAAIVSVESLLNEDARAIRQAELAERFSTVYAHAIDNALAHAEPQALLLALENLAGRRLSGIAAGSVGNTLDAWFTSGMTAMAAERRAGRLPEAAPDNNADRMLRRRIGRIAVAMEIPSIAAQTLDATVVGIHEPVAGDRLGSLVAALPTNAHVLLISPVPGRPSDIVWWHMAPGGSPTIGLIRLAGEADEILSTLAIEGIPRNMTADGVQALGCLLPGPALMAAAAGQPMIVVALGRLSTVPWLALPVGDAFLGELAPVVRCPSLDLYARIAERLAPDPPAPRSISVWRNPTIRWNTFPALADTPGWIVAELESAAAARRALQVPASDVVAIACHGRPVEGIGHYLDLGDRTYLTAADCLLGTPPSTVALVSCWGASSPRGAGRDPLSIAHVLLAHGTRTVLATSSELADSPLAAMIIDDFLYELATSSAPTAYHSAVSRYLRLPAHRRAPLRHWAPGSIIGVL